MSNNPWEENSSKNLNLSEILNEFKKHFQNKDKKSKFRYAMYGLLSLWLLSGFYVVNPDEQGVILRLGKWVTTTNPGLHYKFPAPIDFALTPKVTKINKIEVGMKNSTDQNENLMLTGDSNLANVSFTILWRIKQDGVKEFLFNARSPEVAIRACAESEMRAIVGKNKIVYAQTEGRSEIANQVKEQLQKLLDKYNTGVEIVRVDLQNVEPPLVVIDSFRDVERAQADQQRFINDADAYKRNLLANTRGEVAEILNKAQAKKESVILDARGKSAKFLSVYNQYKTSKEITKKRIYLDTMKDILKSSEVIIVDDKNSLLQHTKI